MKWAPEPNLDPETTDLKINRYAKSESKLTSEEYGSVYCQYVAIHHTDQNDQNLVITASADAPLLVKV